MSELEELRQRLAEAELANLAYAEKEEELQQKLRDARLRLTYGSAGAEGKDSGEGKWDVRNPMSELVDLLRSSGLGARPEVHKAGGYSEEESEGEKQGPASEDDEGVEYRGRSESAEDEVESNGVLRPSTPLGRESEGEEQSETGLESSEEGDSGSSWESFSHQSDNSSVHSFPSGTGSVMGPVDLVVPHWMRGQATTSHLAVAGSSHTPGSDPSTASSSPLLSISDAGSPTPGQGTASTPGSIEAPYWESDPRSLGPHPEDSTPPRVLLVGFGSGTSPGPESGLGALFLNPRPLTLTAREWRVVVDIDVVEIGDRVRAIGETVATLTQELKPLTEKDTRLKPSYFDIKRAAKVARELEEAAGEMREYLPVNRARRGYLVVSQDREYYAALEVFDKETCRQRPMLICPPSFPLVHRSVKECLSSIYFQNSDAAEICEWSVLVQPPADVWRWEAASQKWYYSLSQPVVLTEQCPDEAAVEITLTGSGVIQPQIQCTLRTATHKLLPAGGKVPAQHFLRNRTIDVPTLWSLNATQPLEDKNLDAIVDQLRQQGQVQPGVWSEDEIRLEAALRMLEENEGNGPALVYGLGSAAIVLILMLGLGMWWYRRTCVGCWTPQTSKPTSEGADSDRRLEVRPIRWPRRTPQREESHDPPQQLVDMTVKEAAIYAAPLKKGGAMREPRTNGRGELK
ncbi:hypothetical protein GE061_015633 [Apolygus lucorum]|uniref:Uncharacterized protein n=1 Tax=Apolygus lucorum TaxID=248454 RepID=A0A8S9XLI7_APOLU|nr:hypothetical protein GE061_015633 [Apolygus lucorum]